MRLLVLLAFLLLLEKAPALLEKTLHLLQQSVAIGCVLIRGSKNRFKRRVLSLLLRSNASAINQVNQSINQS